MTVLKTTSVTKRQFADLKPGDWFLTGVGLLCVKSIGDRYVCITDGFIASAPAHFEATYLPHVEVSW